MSLESLRRFVVEAHRNGYPTGDAERTADGGKVIEYRADGWRYLDRYYGSRRFLGSEVVFEEGEPVWGMHYDGAPVSDHVDHEPIYAVLRSALENATLENPYRGPERYVDGTFEYTATVDGSFDRFSGTEEIARDGSAVYRGRFGGGCLE